jgi:hypothetical protein
MTDSFGGGLVGVGVFRVWLPQLMLDRGRAEGRNERAPALAGELVAKNVDLIITFGDHRSFNGRVPPRALADVAVPQPAGVGGSGE